MAVTFVLVHSGFGGTWYVDNVNGNDSDGSSWANAYHTISNAALAMATAGGGGHLILITNAGTTYAEFINMDESYAGASGSPNVFRGVNQPVLAHPGGNLSGSGYGDGMFHLDGAGTGAGQRVDYITLDGFDFQMPILHCAVYAREAYGLRVINCNQYKGEIMVWLGANTQDSEIANCTCWTTHGDDAGLYLRNLGGTMTIRNCIFYGNGRYAVSLSGSPTQVIISNNCFFGSGWDEVRYTDGTLANTADEINGLSDDCGENIVSCPGFADLNNLNYNSFYANSPCLGTADDGGNMGAHQSPTLVPVSSENWYVKTDGDNNASGLDWANAWATVSTAATTGGPGDTVTVAAGTYSESVTISEGGSSNLWLTFVADGDAFIDGSINIFRTSQVKLDGFRNEGGIKIDDGPSNIVVNCDISLATYGVEVEDAHSVLIKNCDIYDCTRAVYTEHQYAYGGGGTYVIGCQLHDSSYGFYQRSGRNVVKDCDVYNNTTAGFFASSGSYNYRHTEIINCNVYSNAIGINGGNHGGLAPYFCTVYANDVGMLAGEIGPVNGGYVRALNCIVAGNTTYGVQEGVEARGALIDTCLFWDNGSGGSDHFYDGDGNLWDTAAEINAENDCTGNLIGDPQFVNTEAANYRILPESAALDAGNDTYSPYDGTAYNIPNLTDDRYGNPRPKLTGLDIGAHEWQPWAGTVILVK